MAVEIKSYNQILGPMVKKILSDTSLSDMRVGSVISTILESAAQSDFEIHTSVVQLIQLFSIDTTTGSDLDLRAAEFNVTRQTAVSASGFVTLGDKSFAKKSSKIYIGLPPPVVGDTAINVEDASLFPLTGSVYLGRGTGNYEGPIAYSSITNNTSYWTINLSSPVTKNHTSVETVILAQGGNRTVASGVVVRSPANNFSPAVGFVITRSVTIPDGENSLDNVPVVAQTPGTIGNVPAGAINQFTSPPFTGATVTNPSNFGNGQDVELDSSLRARIRNAIQLIARGTKQSILQAVKGVSDTTDNKRVVSASLAESVSATVPAQLYIDDGTGFEPSFAGQGVEEIVSEAAGSEQLIQVSNFPITPPILVSALDEPYGVQPGQTLSYRVDSQQETITFQESDFAVPGLVRASEIIDAINARGSLVTSRSVRSKVGVGLVANRFPDGTDPEELQIIGGTANDSIKFPVTISRVMSLYKNGALLRKNAESAVAFTGISTGWSFGTSTVAAVLQIALDNTPFQNVIFRDSDFITFGVGYKTASPAQWATVLASKVAGLATSVETSQLRFASNLESSSNSRLQISLASDLGARASTAAVWKSGNTVRYSVADTTNIVVGDTVTITGFANSTNNGVFPVTRVASADYVECTTSRSNSAQDETGVGGAVINPNKEDLALVFFGQAVDVSGSTSDYILNRFSGEIQLTKKLSSGDNVTAGSQFTSAHIDSLASTGSVYNFPIQQDINPEFFVSFDSASAVRNLLITVGDVLTQTRVTSTDLVTLASNRTNAFANVQVGDFILLVTRSITGTGVGYSPWFPSYATGVMEVTSLTDPQTITVRNPNASYPGSPITGIVSATDDAQGFSCNGLVQRVSLSGVSLLPSTVVGQINANLQFGQALVFNNSTVRIESHSLNESASKVFILAVAGSAKNLYIAGTSASATQPHIAFEIAGTQESSFPRLKDGLQALLGGGVARSMIFGSTTSASLTLPYRHIDSTQTFTTDGIRIDDVIRYQSGLNNEQLLALRSIDSDTQLTPQLYSVVNPIYASDKYEVSESQKFSPSDKLIIELDQDATNKTFLVPMYRTGRVKGIATTTTFDGWDMDSASGTDFNNSIWQSFSFQDFALMFRARNIYKANVSDSSLIIRSAMFGEVGNNIQFSVVYPTAANQAASALHTVNSGTTLVKFFLASGASRSGISNVGSGYALSRSGQTLTLTWAGVGPNPNFSGNGVLVGDIASITDPAFSQKSPFFIGSGKVTSIGTSTMSIRLQGSATISTAYATTSSADSGSGQTTTYAMTNTGLIAPGDLIQISGFSRSINNGNFTVVGVSSNTSITVQHSNRTLITQQTSGYRRTSNTASLQFAGTIAGQVQVGDSIVVSGLAEPTLNGTWSVASITTTTVANDTVTFTAAGSNIPAAITVTSAVWQSGNTVRYASTNTAGVTIGNTVVISGFTNSDNNGTFLVTNVSNNNYIDVTSTRNTSTHDETGVVGATARPTYFVTDSNGTVQVINNETASANIQLVVLQSTASSVAAFPLANTTATAMANAINASSTVKTVITAVNALGYNGTGIITNATFDEPVSVGYNHTPGQSYVQLYDGTNFVLDFYSATININKNFSLKIPLQFSHADYNISTAPNITGEQAGEYFKLVPTTYRNVESWFNKNTVTSFSILGSAGATASGGNIQLSTQTIGTDGAIKVSGGTANGIASFIKIPASLDNGSIRTQVNLADESMFVVGQVVRVANSIASRKVNNFKAGNLVDVVNVNGTTGKFVTHGRAISLANTNSVTITDVSASYGRSSGLIWRWTGSGLPAAPFTGAVVGDVLQTTNTNLSSGNKTSTSTGDGICSFFPVIGVDPNGTYIDIQNPNGVAQGPVTLSGTLNTTVSPALFVEWKHKLTAGDSMKVEATQVRNLYRYTWVSGASSPKFASNGVSVDDYAIITGNTFLPQNRGTFRVVAVDDNYFVVENPNGAAETSDTVNLASDVRFFYSESVIVGDNLNVSDLVFLAPNRGTFGVINYGTDATLKTQYITCTMTNSSEQSSVFLTGLPNTFFVTDGQLFSSYRHVSNFSTDPTDPQSAIVYLQPGMNVTKMSNAFNTSITPIQKLSFGSDTAIGVDGYRYYTGLLATVQKVVDGYDPDPINFPGYKAAGTQIETVPPLILSVTVNVVVKPIGGIALSTLSDAIKAAILNYINGLGVGESVIVSNITAAVMSVEGVLSATLFEPSPTTTSIVVQDNQKAVININDITISSG